MYEDGDVEYLDLSTAQWRFAVRSRCDNSLLPPTDITETARVESTDVVDAQMLVARCIWKEISRHRHWDRPTSTEPCFRFALDLLCSMASANHCVSLLNYGKSFSCSWPQMVILGNNHKVLHALQPHRSTRPDSMIYSNIEQLLSMLMRVIEIACGKVLLKVNESVCFKSIVIVPVALRLSRTGI